MIRLRRTVFLYAILGILVLVYVVFVSYKQISHTWLFTQKERINIVWYGKDVVFYSIDNREGVHYVIPFYSDLKVDVPGGYGYYRIGGLGKLVDLEDDPDLVRKAFSYTTSSFVDFYLISPQYSELYYGDDVIDTMLVPSIGDVFTHESNATLLDRLYLSYLLTTLNKKNTTLINTFHTRTLKDVDMLLQKDFLRSFQGLWYQKAYRDERKNVQVKYSANYKSAYGISNMLEGNGIRVSDISYMDSNRAIADKQCVVEEEGETFSLTSHTIAQFYGCELRHADDTDIYDIIFYLYNLEEDWDIRKKSI